ncbi:MAG: Gfo/Idh/MocA family oxidoreductase [Verrucomicrobia bacterium]|nr:Gfo/Idh/MocA family oxidoreductase [Verrucomicrobiota bacterium]
MSTLNFALVGTGVISLQNHLPGLALCKDVKVTALCDANPATLETARQQTGAPITSTNWEDIIKRDDIHAVIIATPNVFHPPVAIAAARSGKHVLSEKPLALNYADAKQMADEADKARVRHMTAFTYRFVPAMRYLHHLIGKGDAGRIYHYRSCRLQDWGTRNVGWRQQRKMAGTGEIGDMLSHRIDFARHLVSEFKRLVSSLVNHTPMRGGQPNDTDDWVGLLAEFQNGATGVMESSKLASGVNEGWKSPDRVEINGSEASYSFTTGCWNELQYGKLGGPGMKALPIPKEFYTWPGSPRDPGAGDPLVSFRYDQAVEFVNAIREERPCAVTLRDGARAQAVIDAAVKSSEIGQWVELP